MYKKGIMFIVYVFVFVILDIFGIEYFWFFDLDIIVFLDFLEKIINIIVFDFKVGGVFFGFVVYNNREIVVINFVLVVYWGEFYFICLILVCIGISDC